MVREGVVHLGGPGGTADGKIKELGPTQPVRCATATTPRFVAEGSPGGEPRPLDHLPEPSRSRQWKREATSDTIMMPSISG